jgi:predicted PurR-regulated permease PerM
LVLRSRSETSSGLIENQVTSYALPAIAAGVIIAVLYLGRVFFITAIFAVIIALILEPFVGLLTRARLPRSIATFIVGAVALMVLYFSGLAAYNQLSSLVSDAPEFQQRLGLLIGRITDRFQEIEDKAAHALVPVRRKTDQPVDPVPAPTTRSPKRSRKTADAAVPAAPLPAPGAIQEVRIHDDRNPIGDYIYEHAGTVYEFILMASFVPFLVYFMLSWRDHIYRSFLRFFEGPDRMAAARSMEGVAEMARAFVVGNFLIGVLLAVLSWIAFGVIRIPYPFLVGTLSGSLSLVPYIGLPLALVPPVMAALAGGSPSSVGFLAFLIVLFLHLLAMNILYPKLVGARVHLNPLVVTFSLMFWGFLWGAAGLLLAIPITAGIKAVCDNVTDLRPWGRFLGD